MCEHELASSVCVQVAGGFVHALGFTEISVVLNSESEKSIPSESCKSS